MALRPVCPPRPLRHGGFVVGVLPHHCGDQIPDWLARKIRLCDMIFDNQIQSRFTHDNLEFFNRSGLYMKTSISDAQQ